MPARTAATLAIAFALLALSLAPVADAGYKSFGEAVEGSSTDKDVTHLLLVSPAVAAGAEVAFDDVNTNGVVAATEGVYIDSDASGTITALDIRIRTTTGATGTKGEQVKGTADNDCCGTVLTTAPGGWGFVDVFPTGAPDGLLNLGDPIFLDLNGDGLVDVLDIKVTSRGTASTGGVPTTGGSSSLTNVGASDTDIGAAIIPLAGYALNAFDADGDGSYSRGDTLYVDTDSDGLPGPGDFRVNKIGSFSAGTMPKAGDSDTVHELAALGAPGAFLSFVDDGDTVAEANEGIYLDIDGDSLVSVDDIRFIGSTSGGAGKQIIATDSDVGDALTALPGGLAFRDLDADTAFTAADVLYVELDGDAAVEVNDFRLAKGPATTGGGTGISVGQRVTGSGTDLNAPLVALAVCGGACVSFFDFGGSGGGAAVYNRNDVVFLDIDADGIITPGDVRVQAGTSPMTTFGEVITDSETEMEYCYDAILAAPTFAYVEVASPGAVNLDENIYVDRAGGTVSVHDVRLSGDAGTAGSFVASGANDLNSPLTALATVVSFYDANGDSVYSVKETSSGIADTLYLDLDGSGSISVGDLRLTKAHTGSGTAGSRVTSSAPSNEMNGILAAAGTTTFAGLDADADGTFTSKDALYVNLDSAADTAIVAGGCVTPADLRLSGTSTGSQGGGNPTPTPSSAAATVALTAPAANSCVLVNQTLPISGTATAGTTQGTANTISSLGVTVNGVAQTVSGTTSWSTSFTPAAPGTLAIVATVTPSSGNAISSTRSVTVATSCQAVPPPGSEGNGSISSQLQALISQNTQLSGQLNTTLTQNSQLQTQISELSTQLGNQTQQLTSLNGQLSTLQSENARLQQLLLTRGNTTAPGNQTPGLEPVLVIAAIGGAFLLAERRRRA
jgi:hypothetical protein